MVGIISVVHGGVGIIYVEGMVGVMVRELTPNWLS